MEIEVVLKIKVRDGDEIRPATAASWVRTIVNTQQAVLEITEVRGREIDED